MMSEHYNSVQWTQSLGYSRQVCARMFRDGGTPLEAMKAFGVSTAGGEDADWAKAVDAIAQALCTHPVQAAA